MRLPDNYKQCVCGTKLKKKNRFAVKLEAPENINTIKREKAFYPYRTKTVVIYCCEQCYDKLYQEVKKSLNTGWFIYYPDSYGV